ncbi:MAG: sigma 54-interacting transcriptional regulator [Sporomusaceae bacterium]|nr:sigma 54-interacting transcriptional regulator [Sporomusaceae bacterium]
MGKAAKPQEGERLERLLTNELIYEKILETSADGFIVINAEGLIIEINRAYADFLSIKKRESVIGKHIFEVIKNSKLAEVLETGETDVNTVHQLEEGKEPLIAVTRAAVKKDGKVVAAFGQVKFSRETRLLAEKLQNMADELKYYKNELKRIIGTQYTMQTMIGESANFLEVKKTALRASKTDFSVLISGETGTGKEVFAAAIHNASNRRQRPFIRINCAAIPAELLESELFGYEEGAFTGAKKGGKPGKFEMANGGTFFLDEIGEMPVSMQVKLLRVLQEKEIEKVGGGKSIPLNVRIIAATNQNLEEQIRQKKFRSDLYYRLNVMQIKLPPLRERSGDIPLFVGQFLRELYEQYGEYKEIAPPALQRLQEYAWPGNIRELKNTIQRLYAMCEGREIFEAHLPLHLFKKNEVKASGGSAKSLEEKVSELEKEIIWSVLNKNNFNCRATAVELGIHRSTLYKKFAKLKINLPDTE